MKVVYIRVERPWDERAFADGAGVLIVMYNSNLSRIV